MPRRARLGSIHDAPLSIRDLQVDDIAGGIPLRIVERVLAPAGSLLGRRPFPPCDRLSTAIALASRRNRAHYSPFPAHARSTLESLTALPLRTPQGRRSDRASRHSARATTA